MKYTAALTFALGTLAIFPATSFAADQTLVSCSSEYGYTGGCKVTLNTLTSEMTVECSRGVDGDGYLIPQQDNTATVSHDIYVVPVASFSYDATGKGFLFLSDYYQEYDMKCTFSSATPPAPVPAPVPAPGRKIDDRTAATCAKAMNKNGPDTVVTYSDGSLLRGFDVADYVEGQAPRASIVLETSREVYFYSGTSDISASLYVCAKDTGTVSEVTQSHSLDCSDLPKFPAYQTVFSSCASN